MPPNMTLTQFFIAVVVIAGMAALMYVGLGALGIAIPPLVVTVFWIVVVVVLVVVAIRYVSTWF